MSLHTPDELTRKRTRGVRSSSESRYCIEGESLLTHQIAARLGVSCDATRSRLAKLRKAAGPITWGALGLKRE